MIDKQIEYEIRRDMYNLNCLLIESEFKELLHKLNNFTNYELACYCLISIEDGFNEDMLHGITSFENAAPKRTIIEWFFKRVIVNKIEREEFQFNHAKYEQFEEALSDMFVLCGNHLCNEQLNEKRGINKIIIEEIGNNEYTFRDPKIKDDIDSQDTYYYGRNVGPLQFEEEMERKNEATKLVLDKYCPNKSDEDVKKFRILLSLNEIDFDVYNAFKNNIKVDLDKMGADFSSEIIKNKQQLTDILAVFLYISTINMFRAPSKGNFVLIYNKMTLIQTIKRFVEDSIDNDEISNIIDYFTISGELAGGFNEYPLVNIKNNILWIPSSFIMNDFQFALVNGHYDKNIIIKNRANTVSQSVVDAILSECRNYKNIVVSSNAEYFDQFHKYDGGDLKSDIDIAVYDEITNSLLIIECKWKENVFFKGEKYNLICDAVNQIYSKQLDKHKYFLELNDQNLDFIFDNDERIKGRPYFPHTLYIFVDKRIQLHYEGKHALSEFNFLKILKDNSYKDILKLDEVNSCIKSHSTQVEYRDHSVISTIKLGDRVIRNNIFTLKYQI